MARTTNAPKLRKSKPEISNLRKRAPYRTTNVKWAENESEREGQKESPKEVTPLPAFFSFSFASANNRTAHALTLETRTQQTSGDKKVIFSALEAQFHEV